MDLSSLSRRYTVRRLDGGDIKNIYGLCCQNRLFYQYNPPFVTEESIRKDLAALPPGKTKEDKYYIGFFDGERLIAVMDLVLAYPSEGIAFIGFFMTDVGCQRRGIGSGIIAEAMDYLKRLNFEGIRLGVDKGNPQSYAFWRKNDFTVISEEKYILMERVL